MVNLAGCQDPHYNKKLRPHVGYHVALHRSERYRLVLARAANMSWSCRTVRAACWCKRGRHRSVTTVALLEKLFHRINPNLEIDVRHVESRRWCGSTCARECPICRANETPQRMAELPDQVRSQTPCRAVLKDVGYLRVC